MIAIGDRIPSVDVGVLRTGEIAKVDLAQRLNGLNALMVGVPGAFTPTCTHDHIPDLKRSVRGLRRAGYETLFCIAPNDPYVLDLWRAQVDPEGDIEFLSDGNLDFSRATGLVGRETTHFLGERTARFLMAVLNGVVARLVVELDPLCLADARPSEWVRSAA